MKTIPNRDVAEIDKFNRLAHRWWDPEGEFRALHDLNPLRTQYIDRFASIANKKVLDIGCGGGILAESLARYDGAAVTGIDLAPQSLEAAKQHSVIAGVTINYQCIAAEDLAGQQQGVFDVVTCMEMLEHVEDPLAIVNACARLVKPQGWVFFSTINRHPLAYAGAVLVAEYMMNWLPLGTHDYRRFIKPSELANMVRKTNRLTLIDLAGVFYNPFSHQAHLTRYTALNYIMACRCDVGSISAAAKAT